MARCSVCGRGGLTFKVDTEKKCIDCARKEADAALKIRPNRGVSVCYNAGSLKGGGIWDVELRIDSVKERFALSVQNPKTGPYVVYRTYGFYDLIDVTAEEDGADVVSGAVSGAITGGILAGGIGALIGSHVGSYTRHQVRNFDIVLQMNDINCPKIVIPVIREAVYSDSAFFKKRMEEVTELFDLLNYIADSVPAAAPAEKKTPDVHEVLTGVKELKELLDSGAITREEYDRTKKELLGMLKAKPDENDY